MTLLRLLLCFGIATFAACARPAFPAVSTSSSLELVQRSTGFRAVHVIAEPAEIDVDTAVYLPAERGDVERLVAGLTENLVGVSLDARGFSREPEGRADAILEVRVDALIGKNSLAQQSAPVPVQRCIVPLPHRNARCGQTTATPERRSSARLSLALRDAQTGQTLWRTSATLPAHVLDRDQVRRAVQRLMVNFPFREGAVAAQKRSTQPSSPTVTALR